MEHKKEGHPIMPGVLGYGLRDENWKRMWSRLSKILPRVQPPSPPPSLPLSEGGDTDLSGFDTYDPTPEPRNPTPVIEDAWERLEYDRKKFE